VDAFAPRSLSIELELDRLDASIGAAVGEYLDARWRGREMSPDRGPPLPAALCDPATRERLAAWRHDSRRAEMLWRWTITAAVETDPAVAAAVRARDPRAVVTARNAAARRLGYPDYGQLARAQAGELDTPRAAGTRPPAPPKVPGTQFATPHSSEMTRQLSAWGIDVTRATLDVKVGGTLAAGRTFPVAAPRDVRAFVRAPDSAAGARVLAHELGHVAYALGLDAGAPWSLRAAPSRAMDEAVATLVERWLAPRAATDADRAAARAERERRAYACADGAAVLSDAMIDDPGAQLAYHQSHAIADVLERAASRAPAVRRGEWLAERVFRAGAGCSVAQILARVESAL
jgi:hypothetical protein